MGSLSFTVSDGVATLALQRSTCSNAIDITVIRAIHLALDQIQKGEGGAKAVVITGSNDVFCSGLDLHSIDLKTAEARQRAHFEMRRFMDPLILRLSGFRFPIVAAVNGAAVGAGMSLALASDIIIDAKTALDWGLAYAVVPAAELVVRAQAIAHRLATGPCAVLGQIRTLHASTFDNSLQEQLRAERSAQEMTLETQDCVEGVRAFFEKREPNFSEH